MGSIRMTMQQGISLGGAEECREDGVAGRGGGEGNKAAGEEFGIDYDVGMCVDQVVAVEECGA